MVIKEIAFARTRHLENSGDVRVEARAVVQESEDPTEAFRALRAWVDERCGKSSSPQPLPSPAPQTAPARAPAAPQGPGQAPARPPAAQPPPTPPAAYQGHQNGSAPRGAFSSAPRTPKALFAWCKEQEERTGQAVVKYVNGWTTGTAQWLGEDGRGIRMTDFTDDQVQAAFAEVCRVLGQQGKPVPYAPTPTQASAIFAKVGLMVSPEGNMVAYAPSADEVRQELIDAITTVAQMETGADRPDDSQWLAALSSLDAAREAGGLPILADINTCDDVALMQSYLDQARDAVTVG